jgi:serine/threonine protein kinase
MKDFVGPYRIESPLGHGGMGIVYLGVHDHLGREVAIKALVPELTRHPEFRERFFAEARVQARLQHCNIVTIYDLIEDEGNFFIVMEHVPGHTLEALLAQRDSEAWDLDRSLSLFLQILAGLDYAHSKGVIHRDVKPSNVLVADGDVVKLTDFGIALLIGDKRLTASQSTIGTPTYMSPEQILRPRSVDHRSDVYSAAIVLYEVLAGQPPFDAETEYEIKKLQIEAPVPDIRALKKEVPPEVAEALSVALRKDPDERFQSAGAFLRALQGAKEASPVADPLPQRETPASPEPPRPAAQQRLLEVYGKSPRTYQMAAAAVVLILLSGLAFPFMDFGAAREPLEPAKAAPEPRGPALVPTATWTDLATPPLVSPPAASSDLPELQKTGMPLTDPGHDDSAKAMALRAKLRAGAERIEKRIADKDFEAARKELELVRAVADLQPEDLASEISRLSRLEKSIARGAALEQQEENRLASEARLSESRGPSPAKESPDRQTAAAPQSPPAQSQMRAYAIEKTGYTASQGFLLRIDEVVAPPFVKIGEPMTVVAHYVVLSPDPKEDIMLRATIRLLSTDHFAFVLKERTLSIPEGGGMMDLVIPVEVEVKPGLYELQVILLDSRQRLQVSGSSGSFLRVVQ